MAKKEKKIINKIFKHLKEIETENVKLSNEIERINKKINNTSNSVLFDMHK